MHAAKVIPDIGEGTASQKVLLFSNDRTKSNIYCQRIGTFSWITMIYDDIQRNKIIGYGQQDSCLLTDLPIWQGEGIKAYIKFEMNLICKILEKLNLADKAAELSRHRKASIVDQSSKLLKVCNVTEASINFRAN